MNDKNKEKSSLAAVIFSTIAAFIGVQSDKNRQKDFQQSSILPFMVAGIILATLFILGLVLIAHRLAPG